MNRFAHGYLPGWGGVLGRFIAGAATRRRGTASDRKGSTRQRHLPFRSVAVRSLAGFVVALSALLAVLNPDDALGQSTPPAVSTTTPPYIFQSPGAPDHFKRFDQITIQVTFTRAVTVTGTPRIGLDIGGVRRNASYSSGAGDFLLFRYDVGPDDLDADGIDIVANSLELRGGSITGVGDWRGSRAEPSKPTRHRYQAASGWRRSRCNSDRLQQRIRTP